MLVHGNPTWGYLYRNLIPPLVEAGYRVIVPDLLGAGRSDKPNRPESYRVRRHAERTEQLHDLWLGTFPNAEVTRVPDAGHFVQEDAHERVVPALLAHLQRSRPDAASA